MYVNDAEGIRGLRRLFLQTPDAPANGDNPTVFGQVVHFQTQALPNA